jgi:hypothetical protein
MTVNSTRSVNSRQTLIDDYPLPTDRGRGVRIQNQCWLYPVITETDVLCIYTTETTAICREDARGSRRQPSRTADLFQQNSVQSA